MRVKYLKGWVNSKTMDNGGWFYHWQRIAAESEANGKELVVFELPKDNLHGSSDFGLIEKIESLINQEHE